MGAGYICEDAMTDDLVKRLRRGTVGDKERHEAADHIEKLECEITSNAIHLDAAMVSIEKLEAALRELSTDWDCCAVSKNMKLIARKALEGKDD